MCHGRIFDGHQPSTAWQWRSQPKNFGGAKMFEFRRITLFWLEKHLSKHKMTTFSKNLERAWPLWPPLATPMLPGIIEIEYVLQYETRKQGLLLPWKRKLEAGLMLKMTWYVHYHVLEYLCFLATNTLSLRIDCSARCIIKCCFYFYSMHVQNLSHWSCTVGRPWTICLFINWATCLKRLRRLL